jgi:hypothetical protein
MYPTILKALQSFKTSRTIHANDKASHATRPKSSTTKTVKEGKESKLAVTLRM